MISDQDGTVMTRRQHRRAVLAATRIGHTPSRKAIRAAYANYLLIASGQCQYVSYPDGSFGYRTTGA